MSSNRFVGITMLLYGLINPLGVIPIYGISLDLHAIATLAFPPSS
ncbi:MAG: hypothetical protein ACYDAH_19205 [Steroidobacteraceae bacterium]